MGPFSLVRRIGAGGMGEVWAGVHRAQGVPVAVKVITAKRARKAKYRRAFHNEVSAMAGLRHPGVVLVLDYGAVDARAEAMSDGRLVEGSPYLAMELATGTLRDEPIPDAWLDLRATLLSLLDALAHAHARGVVHRDLKPGNVLVFDQPPDAEPEPLERRLRLSDFGLAQALHQGEPVRGGVSGTPRYMAPEQFAGRWRDFGPWTDLYALGCIGYALATGKAPFSERGFRRLKRSHLTMVVPPLRSRIDVPDGYEAWLLRLLQKAPEDRFQLAADAAHALRELPDPKPSRTVLGTAPLLEGVDSYVGTLVDMSVDEGDIPDIGRQKPLLPSETADPRDRSITLVGDDPSEMFEPFEPHAELAPDPAPRKLPSMPKSWRRDEDSHDRSTRLLGAGLGLFGLRALPLVGRVPEREAIWTALRDARRDGRHSLVVLRGGPGIGKTRLAEWMCERAHELGAAWSLRVRLDGVDGREALSRALSRALGVIGMTRARAALELERWMRAHDVDDPYEWRALTEALIPSSEGDPGHVVRFGNADERYAVLHRAMVVLSRAADDASRPLILWLDDAHQGGDALRFAAWLAGRADAGPVLTVLTVEEDALPLRPFEAGVLAKLEKLDGARVMDLTPLATRHQRDLVRAMVGLQGELAEQVVARSGGNPTFAVQLVGDWVERGVLELGPTGFVLSEGEQAVVPDDIHQLWEARVARVTGDRYDDRVALEVAAALGRRVSEVEWTAACDLAGLQPSPGFVADLRAARLTVDEPDGFAFAHGMLLESVERSSREAGRWAGLHAVCAEMLEARRPRGGRWAERLGRHRVRAGEPQAALEPLLLGAAERRAASAYDDALALLDQRDALLYRLSVDKRDPLWAEGLVLRADLLIGVGRLKHAEDVAMRAARDGVEASWGVLVARAFRHAGTAAGRQGQIEVWADRARAAVDAAVAAGDELEQARCVQSLATAARVRGKRKDALAGYRDALARFTKLGDVRGQADALAGMSSVMHLAGDLARTEEYARLAMALFEQVGSRFGAASCQNALGETHRARGDLAAAELAYRRAEGMLRSLGSREWVVPRVNRGLILEERGDVERARKVLGDALVEAERTGRRGLMAMIHAFLMRCAGRARDWTALREHGTVAVELLRETGVADADVATALVDAGDMATGGSARVQQVVWAAWEVARSQWVAMGSVERVAELERRLAAKPRTSP